MDRTWKASTVIDFLRDLPRFSNLIEKGLFDAKGLIGRVYRPNQMLEAMQATGNRSIISAVIDFA